MSRCCRLGREVHSMDCTCGAFSNAFAAELAYVEVDISNIVFDGDGSEGASLCAFAAADAGSRARFLGLAAFLFVAAGDVDAAVVLAFVAELYDAARACFDTCTAGNALVFVDHGESRFGVDGEGVELTGLSAIAQTKATESTSALASVETIGEGAILHAVVVGLGFGVGTSAVATDYSYLRLFLFWCAAEECSNLFCHFCSTSRTAQAVHVALLDESFRHGTAASLSAAATIGARKNLGNLVDEGVFDNFKLLCYKVQHHRKDGSCDAQD